MKKNVKKIMGAALLSAMIMSSTHAYAASSVSGSINGVSCSGRISYATTPAGVPNGVRATTTCGANGTVKARATVYFKKKGKKNSITTAITSSIGGVSITANTNDVGNVYGGKGYHYAQYKSGTWQPSNTIIGTTW